MSRQFSDDLIIKTAYPETGTNKYYFFFMIKEAPNFWSFFFMQLKNPSFEN